MVCFFFFLIFEIFNETDVLFFKDGGNVTETLNMVRTPNVVSIGQIIVTLGQDSVMAKAGNGP